MKADKSKNDAGKNLDLGTLYRRLFNHREVVQSLVENFGHPFLKNADFSTLAELPADGTNCDVLWSVQIVNGPRAVLMLELADSYDWEMAMRLSCKRALYLLNLVEAKAEEEDLSLPLVFSFVIYTGTRPWGETEETDNAGRPDASEKPDPLGLEQYFAGYYKGIDDVEPGFTKFTLLDMHGISEEELSRVTGPIYHILKLERAQHPEEFRQALEAAARDLEAPKYANLRTTLRD